jgi:hypothetical protein
LEEKKERNILSFILRDAEDNPSLSLKIRNIINKMQQVIVYENNSTR